MQSLQWILFSCGMTIEPCLKFYMVPSQSQCMTLRSSSKTLNLFCVKSLQCQLLQSLWLIWIVFGMNGCKILKCFRKEKDVSGELPCPATGLIVWLLYVLLLSYYMGIIQVNTPNLHLNYTFEQLMPEYKTALNIETSCGITVHYDYKLLKCYLSHFQSILSVLSNKNLVFLLQSIVIVHQLLRMWSDAWKLW